MPLVACWHAFLLISMAVQDFPNLACYRGELRRQLMKRHVQIKRLLQNFVVVVARRTEQPRAGLDPQRSACLSVIVYRAHDRVSAHCFFPSLVGFEDL